MCSWCLWRWKAKDQRNIPSAREGVLQWTRWLAEGRQSVCAVTGCEVWLIAALEWMFIVLPTCGNKVIEEHQELCHPSTAVYKTISTTYQGIIFFRTFFILTTVSTSKSVHSHCNHCLTQKCIMDYNIQGHICQTHESVPQFFLDFYSITIHYKHDHQNRGRSCNIM